MTPVWKMLQKHLGGVCTSDVSYIPYQQNSLLTGMQAYQSTVFYKIISYDWNKN
jgi:hypothetical protein